MARGRGPPRRPGLAPGLRAGRARRGPVRAIGPAKTTGTKIRFLPDAAIFDAIDFDYDVLEKRLRELAYLNKGVAIRLTDERGDEPKDEEFFSSGGLGEFVAYLNRAQTPLHPPVVLSGKDEERAVEVEVALQYNESISEMVVSYCNNINTVEGGTHLTGFRARPDADAEHLRQERRAGQEQGPGDHRRGLQGRASRRSSASRVPDPQFEGQTKTKLGNGEVEGIVAKVVNEKLAEFLETEPRRRPRR